MRLWYGYRRPGRMFVIYFALISIDDKCPIKNQGDVLQMASSSIRAPNKIPVRICHSSCLIRLFDTFIQFTFGDFYSITTGVFLRKEIFTNCIRAKWDLSNDYSQLKCTLIHCSSPGSLKIGSVWKLLGVVTKSKCKSPLVRSLRVAFFSMNVIFNQCSKWNSWENIFIPGGNHPPKTITASARKKLHDTKWIRLTDLVCIVVCSGPDGPRATTQPKTTRTMAAGMIEEEQLFGRLRRSLTKH